MPNPNERFKKHKVIRTPGARQRRVVVKKKTGTHKCAICKTALHGMPHGKRAFEVKKLNKTQRRPENLLSSMLCPDCRKIAYQEAVMFKHNIISEKNLDLRYAKYVKMIMKRIE